MSEPKEKPCPLCRANPIFAPLPTCRVCHGQGTVPDKMHGVIKP